MTTDTNGTYERRPPSMSIDEVAQAWARASQQLDPSNVNPPRPQPVAPPVASNEPSWWRRLLGAKSQAEIDREMLVAAYEAKLAIAQLENQLLAECNENLRRWLCASTAAAVNVSNLLGAPPNLPGAK